MFEQPSLPMSRCCAKFIWQGQPPDLQTRATSACTSTLEPKVGAFELQRDGAPCLQALDAQPLVVRQGRGRGRGRGAACSGEFIVAMLQNDNAAQAKPQAVAAGAQSGVEGHAGRRRNSYSGCRAHMSSVS